MKKKFSKILGVGLALVLACSFGLVPAAPVAALIAEFPTIAPVTPDTDDVAGKENAAYEISYEQDTSFTVNVITVTFPAGYTITDGMLGTAAVKSAPGEVEGIVTIGGIDRAVDNVQGDSGAGTIAITLANPYTYVGISTVDFQIVLGITNPILIGPYTGLTVEDDSGSNPAVEAAPVTIIAGAADSIVISPDDVTITADETQTYAAEATDAFTNTFDVTAETTFDIEAGAGGSFTDNVYTPGAVGTWTVTGTYDGDKTDTAILAVTVGAAYEVSVETEVDGTGIGVPAQEVAPGASITVYAITRDGKGNFVENVAADSWSLIDKTDGVVDGDLAPAGASATFTGALVGTAKIHAEKDELLYVDSGTITVIPGAKAGLAFDQQPSHTAGGEAIAPPVTVKIIDAYGNQTIDTDEITIAILTNPGGGTLSGTMIVGAADGVATFSDLSIDKVGEGYTLEATAADLTSDTSDPFNITVGAADALAFVDEPTTTIAGEIISPDVTVEIVDAGGNRITTATNPITIAIGFDAGGGTLGGMLIVDAVDGLATFSDLNIDKTGVGYTLVAANNGVLDPATSDPFDITPAEKVDLVFVLQPTNTGAGETISDVTVEIVDALGNRTADTDNVTIDIATGPGELFGTLEVPAADGLATFSDLSIEEMGVGYTLIATAEGLTSVTSTGFDITVGTAASLVFVDPPTDTVAGQAIAPPVTVKIIDAYGNQTEDGDEITIAIGFDAGGGTLGGMLIVGAVDGLATFSDLNIDKTGVDYTLVATSGVLDPATSAAFDITPAVAEALAFFQQPTDTIAGETISPPGVTVEIVDDFGNRVPTAIESITIGILADPGEGTLSGTVTAVAAVDGLATFSDLSIDKVGSGYTLAVTSSGELDPATSDPFDITPAAVFAIDVAADPTIIAVGGASTITATVTDEYGNNVADDTVVTFETTRGMVSPVTALTASGEAETTLSAGSRSGTATVTATAGGVPGIATVEFTSLAATAITVISSEASIPANGTSTLTITVTLVDEHDNTVPTAGATVHLETTAGGLSLESGATDAGVFTSTLTSSNSPITATVTAKVGGMFSGEVTVDFTSLLEPGQIELREGWNAISLPLVPTDPDIEVVLALVMEDVEVVWAYDPTSSLLERWSSYIPGPEAPIDLTEMEDGVGYWVKMSEDAILTVSGVVEQPEPPESPKTYPVVAGWNFIGFKSLNPMLYDDYLVNIAGDYSVILGYSDGDFYNVHPIEPPPDLMPGSGYWIWMTAEGIIVTLD